MSDDNKTAKTPRHAKAKTSAAKAATTPAKKTASRKTAAKRVATDETLKKAPAKKPARKKPAAIKSSTAKTTAPKTPKSPKTPTKPSAAIAKPKATPSSPANNAQLIQVRGLTELRESINSLRTSKSTRIGLVPTMGALHEGHLRLIDKARGLADHTVVSIFVNPKQFAPTEDLDTYPRDEADDLSKLKAAGVSLVWIPSTDIMYPTGFSTRVSPSGPAMGLETDHRPHFFEGVATVVTKLFNQVQPDFAVFGEKDYQQLCVIRTLVRDLDLNLEIIAGETVRENDGLALSSRNAYLKEKQRLSAPALHETLKAVARDVSLGHAIPKVKADATIHLLTEGFRRVDYVEIRDAETLLPYDVNAGRPGRVLAAAWMGRTRLIDNVPIDAT